MGNRADDEGTDISIYRRPLTDTVHADTPTGAPEQLLTLLDELGFERSTVRPAGDEGPAYIWHEAPGHLGEDETKRLATRAFPPCSRPVTPFTSATISSIKTSAAVPWRTSARGGLQRQPLRPQRPARLAARVAEPSLPALRPTGVRPRLPPRPPSAVPYVLAAPGHLAGGGDREHLTEPLLRGHGWHNVSTIDYHTALASPDGRLHVVHDPRAGWTWNLRATAPDGRP